MTRVREGTAWKERSAGKASGGAQSGRTSFGSICEDVSGCIVGMRYAVAHRHQTPVQQADQALHGCAGDADGVLHREQPPAHGQVRQQADGEGDGGQGEADDGEVLHVPSVRLVDGVGVVDEVGEGVGEGAEAEELPLA